MTRSVIHARLVLVMQRSPRRCPRAGFCLLLVCAAYGAGAGAGAGAAHGAGLETEARIVHELAVASLPQPLQSFLQAQAGCLRALALGETCRFDGEILESGDEPRTHYVMLDIAATGPDAVARLSAARSFPQDARKARRLFARKKKAGGSLPWALLARHDDLVLAMRQAKPAEVLVATAGIMRLCLASAMPFNTTSDRDGCGSGNLCWQPRAKQADTHNTPRGRCERALLDRLGPRLVHECRVWPERVKETDDPLGAIFDVLLGSNAALHKLLKLDRDTCQRLKLVDEEAFADQEQAYFASMAGQVGSLWEERLEAGALLAGKLVLSAWHEAGKPVIQPDEPRDPVGVVADSDPPKDAALVASRNSTVFHRPTCQHAKRIHARNKLTYATAKAAEAAGRTPCRTCKPVGP